MHELAVTQGILDIAVAEAEKSGKRKVTQINIKLGVFSGMVPQCIQEYYDIISEDTAAAGAKLIFDKIPAVIRCRSCGAESEIERFRLRFYGFSRQILSGTVICRRCCKRCSRLIYYPGLRSWFNRR